MRASQRDPERDQVTQGSYYGTSNIRENGVATRAKDAAFTSLRHAKDQAFDSITEGVGELTDRTKQAGRGVADFVGTHAIPLTLLGAGMGWLLVNMSSKRRAGQQSRPRNDFDDATPHGAGERMGQLADRATHALQEGRDRIGERVHDIGERVHDAQVQLTGSVKELGKKVSEGASHAGERAASYGRQAYGAVERAGVSALKLGEDNPFVTGLMALVLGAVTGLLLPGTRRENRLLGATRDHLFDAAQRSASELKQTAQHGVEELKSVIQPSLHASS